VAHTTRSAREANLLGTLSLAVTGRVEAALAEGSPYGPSAPAALAALEGYLGGEPIDALARVLDLTHSGAVRLVDRLAGAGLVERRRGGDGRSVAVTLTPAGHRAAAEIRAARERALAETLSVLGAEERRVRYDTAAAVSALRGSFGADTDWVEMISGRLERSRP